VNAEKAALDVQADQVLAGLAETRRGCGNLTAAALPLARVIARRLRAQFPGRDTDNARVLATVTWALREFYAAAGADPAGLIPGLLHVLGYAADELNRGDGPRLEGTAP
jgi:hypothetical protein